MPRRPTSRLPLATELVASLVGLLLASGLAWTPGAEAAIVVSYQVEGGLLNEETIGGTTVRPSDLVDVDTNALVFNAFGDNPLQEDLDAAFVRPNGNIIFSTDTDVNQAFPGLPNGFLNGDLVEWDGATGSIFFSESNFTAGGNPNISAVYLFESGPNAGNLVLGTKGADDELGGMAFEWGNLLLYDMGSDSSSLFFDQDLISGTLTQKIVDGVHVLGDGNLVLSISIDNGSLGGLTLRDQDLVEYDPDTDMASLFLDGDGLFDGVTRDIDAIFVPEPGTLLLLGLGILGLAFGRRRREDADRAAIPVSTVAS